MTRLWQSAAVSGAAYAAITYVLVNVLPSEGYSTWLKVCAIWIAVCVTLAVNGFMAMVLLRETFWQEVAYRRMLTLERLLGFRLATFGQRAEKFVRRPRVLDVEPVHLRLARTLSRSRSVPILFALLGTVQALIIATGAALTLSLLRN
ncbi:MAG: hypothetical protein WD359_00240 [Dehalococcoidia bacterium]